MGWNEWNPWGIYFQFWKEIRARLTLLKNIMNTACTIIFSTSILSLGLFKDPNTLVAKLTEGIHELELAYIIFLCYSLVVLI
jgi:hypothetical protein